MIKKMLTVAGVAVLGLGITMAYADIASARGGERGGMRDGKGGGGGMLERLDADGDGKVSRTEYTSHFDKLDRDGDGYITSEEINETRSENRTQRRNERFTRDDANGDGKLSRDEFSGPSRAFSKIDADNDGFISQMEAAQFRPARDKMRQGGQSGRGMDGMDGGQGGQRGPGGPGGPDGPDESN